MKLGILLLLLTLGSAIALVTVRHENRLAFIEWQEKQERKNELQDQWGRLVLERATWAGEHSIAEEADKLFGMSAPEAEEIVTIQLRKES